ncbi:MAG: 1-deoxy-D-xylulose-5-phosphate reductoisomerase [Rhodocyclaceae bacterium]|nr:1-deoxy-D-xylulose-5-phosphate reductoisomerase [Rhodocyclaceae bacterium]
MPHRQRLAILGATGSIGMSTLDVALRHPDRFRVVALTAHRQVERLFQQCLAARPVYAVLNRQEDAAHLQRQLRDVGCPTEVLWGDGALSEVAAAGEVDAVMAAIVGAAGLVPTLAAVRAGKRVLLANKEALVMAGALFMAEVKAHGAVLLPVDSEHNAVFQSLPERRTGDLRENGVRRILLTASGGPFRTTPIEKLQAVTPEEACAHPNWVMGRKISVDSATMMNKGLEVIEACWLFGVPADRIEVVIHPQSVIHSMVSYDDGSVIAELGNPDMRTPIAHALAYPERIAAGVAPLDLCAIGQLSFEKPDFLRFPCLGLAYRALELGGTSPAILNAANEVAVEAFLDGSLPFLAIPRVIAEVLESLDGGAADSLEAILDADARARERALSLLPSRNWRPDES